MPEPRQTCPNCGATLRGRGRKAFCPRCVLRLGLSESQLRLQADSPEQASSRTDTPANVAIAAGVEDSDLPRDMVGRMLGEYEILAELGRGGMGVVYKAFDEALSRIVALKVLAPRLRDNPSLLRRFRREAQSAARLQHPNIVSIYGVGRDGDEHFFVMEFVCGVDLAEHLKTNGPMKTTEVVDLARQVGSALAAAHDAGIVHRDITPRNIMVDTEGRVRVLDFGLAKWEETQIAMARLDGFAGTLRYSAPEQCAGLEVDGRTDLYSLGVVLYEMLTGSLPYDADTPWSLVNQIESMRPPLTSLAAPGVDPAIGDIVDRLLAKSPADRFASAGEFLANLDLVEAMAQRRRAEYRQYVSDIQVAAIRLRDSENTEAREALVRAPAHCRHWEWGWLVARAWPERRISDDAPLVRSKPGDSAAVAWEQAWGRVIARIVAPDLAALDFSQDGRHMVTAAHRGDVVVWEVDSGERVLRFTAPSPILNIAYSHDGARIATAQADRNTTIWDARTGKQLLVLEGHRNQVQTAHFGPDDAFLVTTSFDSTTRVWDTKTGRQIGEPIKGRGQVRFGERDFFVRWSDESRWQNRRRDSVWRYDLQDLQRVATLDMGPKASDGESEDSGVTILELSPDLKQAVGCTGAGELVLGDIADGKERFRLRQRPGTQMEDIGVKFSPDGSCLALCLRKGEEAVRIHDARTGSKLTEFRIASIPVMARFCPRSDLHDHRLAISHKDGTVLVIAPARTAETATPTVLSDHTGMVYRVAFSPGGGRFATASHDGTAIVWDATSRSTVLTLSGHRGPVFAAHFSPDGKRILTLSWDKTARIWESDTGKVLHVIPTGGPPEDWGVGPLAEAAARDGMTRATHNPFTPDGGYAAIPQCGFGARIFDVRTGDAVQELAVGPDWVWTAECAEGSRGSRACMILTPTLSGAVVWDGETARRVFRRSAGDRPLYWARLSPCGNLLVLGYAGGTVQVWDLLEDQILFERDFPSAHVGVLCADFSPDGSRIACANFGSAWILHSETGEITAPLTERGYGLSVATFSPDGKRVLTVSPYYRCVVGVWDLEGNELAQLACEGLRTARWSPDGTSIITSSETAEGSLVRFWDAVPPPEGKEGGGDSPGCLCEYVDRWRRRPRNAPTE